MHHAHFSVTYLVPWLKDYQHDSRLLKKVTLIRRRHPTKGVPEIGEEATLK